MEESKLIQLPLGHISFEKELGVYYIDMRPARIHYTENIWGGYFDEKGVPMIMAENNLIYSPVNICQYGFILHSEWKAEKDQEKMVQLNSCLSVLETLKQEDEHTAVWYQHHVDHKYHIQPPWPSAMTQGEIISFYLRMYQEISDIQLLRTAEKAYTFMQKGVDEGGIRRCDEKKNVWLEEYPSEPPSYVLNGFIYAIWGLYDLYRVTERADVKADIDACVKTLKENIHRYDSGYWSYYDLVKKELVRYYYQKNVHVPQLEVMYALTGIELFKHYSDKWKKTLTPFNFLKVKIMYRVRPRLQKLKKLWKN